MFVKSSCKNIIRYRLIFNDLMDRCIAILNEKIIWKYAYYLIIIN